MKSIKDVLPALLLFGSTACKFAVDAPSLCEPTESVVFFCATAASKIVALCRDKHSQITTYRYGTSKRVEMSYSAKLRDEDGFFYNHYVRPNVDYMRIFFVTSGYQYSIFRNYDAIDAPVPKYGLIVSRNGDDEAQIECDAAVVDNMSKIIRNLKCDLSSALGCS